MNKTQLLKTDLVSRMKSALTAAGLTSVGIFYQKAMTPGATYIVYNVDEVTQADGRLQMELELNVIDYGTNTAQAEDIADTMRTLFDHAFFSTDDIAYYCYAGARNTISSDDEKAVRRRCKFELYLYERN